jgi:hypothetical protein
VEAQKSVEGPVQGIRIAAEGGRKYQFLAAAASGSEGRELTSYSLESTGADGDDDYWEPQQLVPSSPVFEAVNSSSNGRSAASHTFASPVTGKGGSNSNSQSAESSGAKAGSGSASVRRGSEFTRDNTVEGSGVNGDGRTAKHSGTGNNSEKEVINLCDEWQQPGAAHDKAITLSDSSRSAAPAPAAATSVDASLPPTARSATIAKAADPVDKSSSGPVFALYDSDSVEEDVAWESGSASGLESEPEAPSAPYHAGIASTSSGRDTNLGGGAVKHRSQSPEWTEVSELPSPRVLSVSAAPPARAAAPAVLSPTTGSRATASAGASSSVAVQRVQDLSVLSPITAELQEWSPSTGTRASAAAGAISSEALQRAVTTASSMADWAGRAVRNALKEHLQQPSQQRPAQSAASAAPAAKALPSSPAVDLTTEAGGATQDTSPAAVKENTGGLASPVPESAGAAWLGSPAAEQVDVREARRQFNRAMRDTETLTEELKDEVIELLQVLNLPYIIAPFEAEAQCAVLQQVRAHAL